MESDGRKTPFECKEYSIFTSVMVNDSENFLFDPNYDKTSPNFDEMSSQFWQGRVATPGSLAFFVVASVVSFNGNSFSLDITCVCSSLVVRLLLWIRKREDISWADFAQEKAWASFRG